MTTTSMRMRLLLFMPGMLVACQHSLKVGDPNPGAGQPGAYDAGAGTCSATCSTPPGDVDFFNTDDEVRAALVGVWQFCAGAADVFPGIPSDAIGIELTPATLWQAELQGNVYFITKGPSGPVRGAGANYQGTYVVDWGQMYLSTPSTTIEPQMKYSPCPREWQFDNYYGSKHKGILVPF
jgi:hypothetical protein